MREFTSRTAHSDEVFNVSGVVGGKLWLRNRSEGGIYRPLVLIIKDDLSTKSLKSYDTCTMGSPNSACTLQVGNLDGPCSVQSRSFQVRVATARALFLRPKNMGTS